MFKHLGLAAAATFALLSSSPAHAGRGGSVEKLQAAVASGSVDAIVAEVERLERKMCNPCIDPMTALLEHGRDEVRQVAAWWFAKRPGLKTMMIAQMVDDLAGGSTLARNAADFLGTVKALETIPALTDAVVRSDLSVEARRHVVRALGRTAHPAANPGIEAAMADADASVRVAALDAWHEILRQQGAAPAVGLLADGDASVRARAAAVVGGLREGAGRAQLEALLTDADPTVRRNAAWALGRLGAAASRAALEAAQAVETSAIVKGALRAALASA